MHHSLILYRIRFLVTYLNSTNLYQMMLTTTLFLARVALILQILFDMVCLICQNVVFLLLTSNFHYFLWFRQQICNMIVFNIRGRVVTRCYYDLRRVIYYLYLICKFKHLLFLLVYLGVFTTFCAVFYFLTFLRFLIHWVLIGLDLVPCKLILASDVAICCVSVSLNGGLLLEKLLDIILGWYLHAIWLMVPRIHSWIKYLVGCMRRWNLFYCLLHIWIHQLVLNHVLALVVKLILWDAFIFKKLLVHPVIRVRNGLPLRSFWSFWYITYSLVSTDLLAFSISIGQLIFRLSSCIWVSQSDIHTVDFQFIAHL